MAGWNGEGRKEGAQEDRESTEGARRWGDGEDEEDGEDSRLRKHRGTERAGWRTAMRTG